MNANLVIGQLRNTRPNIFGGSSKDHERFHELIVLGVSGKKGLLVRKLCEDGSDAPHIQRSTVPKYKQNKNQEKLKGKNSHFFDPSNTSGARYHNVTTSCV
jgi:hypothetical protein